MLKKTMLFALAALATMAFAVPAVASASKGVIYDTTTEMTLQPEEELTFTGLYNFNAGESYSNVMPSCPIEGTFV